MYFNIKIILPMWKKNEQKGKSISSQYAFVKEKKLMSPKNDLDSSSDLETISRDKMPASHFNMKTNSFQGTEKRASVSADYKWVLAHSQVPQWSSKPISLAILYEYFSLICFIPTAVPLPPLPTRSTPLCLPLDKSRPFRDSHQTRHNKLQLYHHIKARWGNLVGGKGHTGM